MDLELRDAFERLTSDLRAEIQSGDAELRNALGQLASDLRSEIRSGDAELRDALGQVAIDLRAEIRSGDAELRVHLEAATTQMRRHFDVVGEALRGDIRSLAELMAMSNERLGRRMDEGDSRAGGLEGRVLALEARVTILEDDRKSRRSRRRQ